MKIKIPAKKAEELLTEGLSPLGTETVPLENCLGRVLAEDLRAELDMPPFDRSAYDGYAFRSADTAGADREHPVTLQVLEEVAAGSVPMRTVTEGTAVRILTGAPIPKGADAVCMFEKTSFTEDAVTLFSSFRPQENIVRAGEDIRKGMLLLGAGSPVDAGLMGSAASQNRTSLSVYRKPSAGVISTGNEILEAGETLKEGRIFNSSRFTLGALLRKNGCTPVYYGNAGDRKEEIRSLAERALKERDLLILTGGASVGKYDLTAAALEEAGVQIRFDGVAFKPGMACVGGIFHGKPVLGLSGNPASAYTAFCVIGLPMIRKLSGLKDYSHREIPLVLKNDFPKKSPAARYLRGILDLSGGTAEIDVNAGQGNAVLSSAIGVDVMAEVPAGSGPLPAGTVLKGFLV